MPQVTLTVNGKQHTVAVEARTLLVELLREKLSLTGTHVGCDTSQCGACVVHVDGISAKSCTMLALQAEGTSVLTIEGLAAADGTLHPMQEMFREHHALQCGFCTPGMVLSAIDLVNSHPQGMTEKEIREGLDGNLCRCTGYHNIVKAIDAAQPLMHAKEERDGRENNHGLRRHRCIRSPQGGFAFPQRQRQLHGRYQPSGTALRGHAPRRPAARDN